MLATVSAESGAVVAVIIFIAIVFLGTVRTNTRFRKHQAQQPQQSSRPPPNWSPQISQTPHKTASRQRWINSTRTPHPQSRPTCPTAPSAPAPTLAACCRKNEQSQIHESSRRLQLTNAKNLTSRPATSDTKQANWSRNRSQRTRQTATNRKRIIQTTSKPLSRKQNRTSPPLAPLGSTNRRSEPATLAAKSSPPDQYATIDECYQAIDVYLLSERPMSACSNSPGDPMPKARCLLSRFDNGAIFADGKLMSYGRGNTYWEMNQTQGCRR